MSVLILELSLKGIMQLEFSIEEEERLEIRKVTLECLYFIFNELFMFFEPEYFLYVLTFD